MVKTHLPIIKDYLLILLWNFFQKKKVSRSKQNISQKIFKLQLSIVLFYDAQEDGDQVINSFNPPGPQTSLCDS